MAITTEFLAPLFEGVEGGEERVSKILSEHESELIGLKRKNEELLGSVKSVSEKHETLLKGKETLEATVKELNEKLESALPDKEKQYFQTQIEQLKTNAATTAAELNKQLSERDQTISVLNADHHNYICHQIFEKLLNADLTIASDSREVIETYFFARNQFEWIEVNGEKKLLNKDSRSMKDALSDLLNSPAGQRFKLTNNTGGGAAGGAGTKGGGNTMTREQFEKLNPVQKQEFMGKHGTLIQ